jgi:hypothetical protein
VEKTGEQRLKEDTQNNESVLCAENIGIDRGFTPCLSPSFF